MYNLHTDYYRELWHLFKNQHDSNIDFIRHHDNWFADVNDNKQGVILKNGPTLKWTLVDLVVVYYALIVIRWGIITKKVHQCRGN